MFDPIFGLGFMGACVLAGYVSRRRMLRRQSSLSEGGVGEHNYVQTQRNVYDARMWRPVVVGSGPDAVLVVPKEIHEHVQQHIGAMPPGHHGFISVTPDPFEAARAEVLSRHQEELRAAALGLNR